jgi:hypothetical protein
MLGNRIGYSDASVWTRKKSSRIMLLAHHINRMVVKYLVLDLYNGVSDLAARRPIALNRHQSS